MNNEYPKPFSREKSERQEIKDFFDWRTAGDGEIFIGSLSRRGQLPVRMVGTRIPADDGRAGPVLAARGQERRDAADLS